MRNVTLVFTILGCLWLTGCADLFVISRSIPRSGIPDRLGECPDHDQRLAIAERVFDEVAIDPDSVKVRKVSRAVPGWGNGGLWGWRLGLEGWLWSVQFNGRNRMGGYAGWKTYYLLHNPNADQTWYHDAGNKQVFKYAITED